MKYPKAFVFLFLLLSFSFQGTSQTKESHYVVIGAFRVVDNAARFTASANRNGFSAQYALQPERKLFYVYLLTTGDKKKAYNFLIKIKVETNYKDAWVYSGKLGTDEVTQPEPKPEPKVEPKIEPKIEPVIEPVVSHVKKDSVKIETPKIDSSTLKKTEPVEVKKPKGKPFYIRVVSKADGKELFGNLQLQEPGATQYQAVKSGEVIYLEAPRNKKGTYNLIAQLPGYKQSNLSFNYSLASTEKGGQNEEIITVNLDKAKKGDYIDFTNVHFFKNTSVMQPESQNELDGLVNLLKENLKYKIKIYGHCNGKQDRETYTLGTSTKFFAMDPKGNKKQTISSKELSEARAETVKAYLVQQGITADRIATKGEGGKIPLYPEGGTLGQYNDRVEVEFVKN
ncbi:MAG: OmpA family protein [Bacteroidetes bacterium]|nr:OmpA family protein [Bacteroidota bacterium]